MGRGNSFLGKDVFEGRTEKEGGMERTIGRRFITPTLPARLNYLPRRSLLLCEGEGDGWSQSEGGKFLQDDGRGGIKDLQPGAKKVLLCRTFMRPSTTDALTLAGGMRPKVGGVSKCEMSERGRQESTSHMQMGMKKRGGEQSARGVHGNFTVCWDPPPRKKEGQQ